MVAYYIVPMRFPRGRLGTLGGGAGQPVPATVAIQRTTRGRGVDERIRAEGVPGGVVARGAHLQTIGGSFFARV